MGTGEGTSGAALEPPRWVWPLNPNRPPSSLACPRDATPGRGRRPAPQLQSLARSHGKGGAGDKPTRRDACCPSEGTGAGLPRSLPIPEEPLPCPGAWSLEEATRFPAAAGRWIQEKPDTGLTPSPKRARGKGRKPGARGKGEEARAGRGCRGARAATLA